MSDIKIPSNIPTIDISQIKPYSRNARINESTVNVLLEILPIVGFNQPILVDKNLVIIKGHARYKAAFKLGMKKVPYIISENDEETNKFDRIADNKISELSRWNEDLLLNELGMIDMSILETLPNLPKLEDIVTINHIYSDNIESINNNTNNNSTIYNEDGNLKNTESNFSNKIMERKNEMKEAFLRLQCPHCKEKFDINKKDVLSH